MFIVSKQQALDRWDLLSEDLREGLVSSANSDFLWKTCEAEHIPEEKIYTVSKIAGAVLMGFLHPGDVAGEIRDEIGIDIRIATPIAEAIDQRIFVPLRAEIDAVYNPITKTSIVNPKIVEEVKVPVLVTSAPAPINLSSAFKTASASAPTVKPTVPSSTPTPSIPKPPTGPMIFQTQSIPKPIKNAPDFHMPTVSEDIMGSGQGMRPLAVKPAVIELGNIPTPKPAAPKTSETKVIHYSNLKTSLPAELPTTPVDAKRTITEVTPQTIATAKVSIPKTPAPFKPIDQIPVPSPIVRPTVAPTSTPPRPPVAPKPAIPTTPTPATPQPEKPAEKVIQKNYSEEEK
jgi:hypothetical protein